MKWFYVYTLAEWDSNDVLYVGMTSDPKLRLKSHKTIRLWGNFSPEMTIISRHKTQRTARIKEREAIRRLAPRWNIQHAAKRSSAIDEGAAREIWFGNPGLVNKEVLAKMDGWHYSKAYSAFGPRRLNGELRRP